MIPPFFLALGSSLFDVLDTVVYKRAADLAEKVKADANILYFFGYVFIIAVVPIIYLVFPKELAADYVAILGSWKHLGIFALIAIGTIFLGALLTKAYSNEKISVLAPYSQISEISSIIIGFVVFHSETSTKSFVAAVVASAAIFFSNFENGKLEFNKNCLMLAASEVLRAVVTILAASIVISYHPFTIVTFQNFLGFLILWAYFLLRPKGFVIPKWADRFPFFWTNAVANFCWIFVTAINLYLFREIGVVATILLSMITLAVTMIASYFVYGDIPRKKDVVTAALVLLCIGVGFV